MHHLLAQLHKYRETKPESFVIDRNLVPQKKYMIQSMSLDLLHVVYLLYPAGRWLTTNADKGSRPFVPADRCHRPAVKCCILLQPFSCRPTNEQCANANCRAVHIRLVLPIQAHPDPIPIGLSVGLQHGRVKVQRVCCIVGARRNDLPQRTVAWCRHKNCSL